MAGAVSARIQGDDYQARWFWLRACDLLEPHTRVKKVVYEEKNLKSLDDVVVYYNDDHTDSLGNPLHADFYQVKYHVTQAGSLTAEALTQPSFINAQAFSLLQRIHEAFRALDNPSACRFYLYSPWQVHPDDPMSGVVSNQDGGIDWNRLVVGGAQSKTGKVRKLWMNHLELQTEDDLCAILKPVRFHVGPPMDELGRRLNDRLRSVGLKPVDPHTLSNVYDELIKKLLVHGKTEMTATELERVCKQEGLWDGGPRVDRDRIAVGIRSFTRWAEDLQNRTAHLACFTSSFNGRAIKAVELWQVGIYPEISRFVEVSVRPNGQYLLHLDTHTSIAFAAGFVLPSKANVDVAVVQKTYSGEQVWHCVPGASESESGQWEWDEELYAADGTDTILGISLAQDVRTDVQSFVRSNLPQAASAIFATLPKGPGNLGILSGPHAYCLAQALVQKVAAILKDRNGGGRLHVFAAAPNGFMFFFGRLAQPFQRWSIYEYDFESNVKGAYSLSIEHPVVTATPREQLAREIIREGV